MKNPIRAAVLLLLPSTLVALSFGVIIEFDDPDNNSSTILSSTTTAFTTDSIPSTTEFSSTSNYSPTDTETAPSSTTETSSDTTTTGTTETTNSASTTGTTPHGDPRCEDGEIHYFPIPENCGKYIECYQGNGYEMTCPSGTYFSGKLQECVAASESECCNDNNESCYPETSTTSTTTGTTPHGDPRCGDGIQYLPDPDDCKKYLECYEGDSYEMSCPKNLYYSDIIKECVKASESECCQNGISPCD